MRAHRLLPPLAVLAGLGALAFQWNFVAGAYRADAAPAADIQLNGLDLAIEPTPIGPSPYLVTPAPDTRAVPVELAYEAGETVAAPTIIGGSAALTGVVQGPDGPVAGAVVRLERHTVDGLAVTDATTNELGRWTVANLLGGRYRVRAWLTGQATMGDSSVFLLGADETRTLPLALEAIDTTPRLRFTHKGDIFVGLAGTVAVSVTVRTVDDDGFVVVNGLAGAVVSLTPASPLLVPDAGVVTADGDGVARFRLTCRAEGATTATIVHQGQSLAVDLPLCVPPPPPPTTVPVAPPATVPATPPTTARPATPPTTARPGAGTTRG